VLLHRARGKRGKTVVVVESVVIESVVAEVVVEETVVEEAVVAAFENKTVESKESLVL